MDYFPTIITINLDLIFAIIIVPIVNFIELLIIIALAIRLA